MTALEVLCLKPLLIELGFFFIYLFIFLTSIPILWCDNQSAAALASNPKFHIKAKHSELDVHFLR